MHILGLSAGSRYGNSEILLDAALREAENSSPGVTTSIIRVPELRLPRYARPLPSSLLPQAVATNPDDPGQDDPDDRQKVYDAMMDADAIIISTPVYSHMPPGCLKTLVDGILGPHAQVCIALDYEPTKGARWSPLKNVDPRLVKPRVSGFIVVAGSGAEMPEQWSLGLVALHQTVYPLQATTVDQIVIPGVSSSGSVLINKDKTITRAALLGQRVASQLNKPMGTATYLGPELEGACPYCHLRIIQLGKDSEIECGTCGARGKTRVGDDGTLRPEWETDSGVSHLTLNGQRKHMRDLESSVDEQGPMSRLGEDYQRAKTSISSRVAKL